MPRGNISASNILDFLEAIDPENNPYNSELDRPVEEDLHTGRTYFLDHIPPSVPHKLNPHEKSLNPHTKYDT